MTPLRFRKSPSFALPILAFTLAGCLAGDAASELADAIDLPYPAGVATGTPGWFRQTTTTHDGQDAARSGAIGDGQSSELTLAATGPGRVGFWWKVSSERGYDRLKFFIDGVKQPGEISGEVDWQRRSFLLTPGPHTLKWVYTKDRDGTLGRDCGWVDGVSLPSGEDGPLLSVEYPAGSDAGLSGPVDFGELDAGETATKTFTLRNVGSEDLTELGVSVAGPDAADFSIGALGATTLAPGETMAFEVTFTPNGAGFREATLAVSSNDPGANPLLLDVFAISAPSNDAFGDRIVMDSARNVSVSGSVALAGTDGEEPDISSEDDQTVWYEWTAPAGLDWARIELSDPEAPTVLSVFRHTAGDSLGQIAKNRRAIPALPNRLSFPATPGTTYLIRVAVRQEDLASAMIEHGGAMPDLDFTLELSGLPRPATATDYIRRGRARMQLGTDLWLRRAEEDFAAALEMEPDNDEAHALHALASLLLLETEPAFAQLLEDLGATRTGNLRQKSIPYVEMDGNGIPIPAPGANTAMVVEWFENEALPRLAAVREELALISADDFRTDLTARETGGLEALVDKGDILVLKALTHGVEMVCHLLFTYDLEISLEAAKDFALQGNVTARQTMNAFSNLLEFAASDRRPQFEAAMRAMEADYLEASEFIRNRRGDPTSLATEGLSTDPEAEAELRGLLAMATSSLDGNTVVYRGVAVNLSRLVATPVSIRGFLPEVRGNELVPGTLPSPTFDGILPDMSQKVLDNAIYRLGILWGMAQYAEDMRAMMGYLPQSERIRPPAPYLDSDGDGRDNATEWLQATHPFVRDVLWQDFTRTVIAPGQVETRLTFVRRKGIAHWDLQVLVSDDMETWDRSGAQVELLGLPMDNGDGFTETVTYRLTDAAALSKRKFLRVEAAPKR